MDAYSPFTLRRTRRWLRLAAAIFATICALLLLDGALPGGAFNAAAQGGPDPDALFATPTPLPPLHGPLLGANSPQQAGIILYDLSTGEQRELSFGPGNHWLGSFAPDGCRIAFSLSDPGGQHTRIYSARIDGSDLHPLVDFHLGEGGDDPAALDWEAWTPLWSPQGDRIAFVLLRTYERGGETVRASHIAWVPPEGGPPTFYSTSGTEGEPAWRNDGAWLAYTSYELNQDDRREADVWIVSADGGSKFRLTEFAAGSTIAPRWSPSGEVIAFVYAPTGNNHQFWTVPASGGDPQQWSETWTLVLAFDWLPDGRGLVAAIKDWQGETDNRLYRVPLPGFADTDATLYLDHPLDTAVDYPALQPGRPHPGLPQCLRRGPVRYRSRHGHGAAQPRLQQQPPGLGAVRFRRGKRLSVGSRQLTATRSAPVQPRP